MTPFSPQPTAEGPEGGEDEQALHQWAVGAVEAAIAQLDLAIEAYAIRCRKGSCRAEHGVRPHLLTSAPKGMGKAWF